MQDQILAIANQAKDDAREARIMAMDAQAKIDSYVKVMTVQHGSILDKIDSQNRKMDKMEDSILRNSEETMSMVKHLYNRAWVVAGALIITLISAIGGMGMWILSKIQF